MERWGVLFAAGLVGGCPGAPEEVVDSCSATLLLPPSVSTDILFVIDNSGSMAEEQAKVVSELEGFVSTLANAPLTNDFQVGVITTAVSRRSVSCDPAGPEMEIDFPEQSGRLQLGRNDAGEVVAGNGKKILSVDDPEIVPQFEILVRQGTRGSGQEMGLEAMRLALSEPLVSTATGADPPGNAAFLRPGARLLVVIVSDEDDCSDPARQVATSGICGGACTGDADCPAEGEYCIDAGMEQRCWLNTCETPEGRAALEPVQSYVDFLDELDDGRGVGRAREVYLSVIGAVNPDEPTEPQRCGAGGERAQGMAVRYLEAVQAKGDRGFIDSICRDDYGETLRRIAELVGAPQILELPENPADERLLRVTVTRDGEDLICTAGDGFEFEPAIDGAPARIVMEDRCRLKHGDEVRVDLICVS